jgi:hypothetical protein
MQLSLHWGTFVKATPATAPGTTGVQLCLQLAETALRRFGLQVFDLADEAGDYAVAGQTPDGEIIVQIVCVPLDAVNSWIILSSYANASPAAEQMRNLVREHIVNSL